MAEFLRKYWLYLLGALALHVLFAAAFGVTMISMSRNAPPPQLAIEAVLVDPSTLARASRQQEREREQQRQREQAAQEQAAREKAAQEQAAQERAAQEKAAQEQAAQERRAQEEAARRESEQRAEQARQVELKQREEADRRRQLEEQQLRERKEAERKREQEAEKQKQAEAERQKRAEEERKRREEIARKQREAEQKRRAEQEARDLAAREAELKAQLAEEEGRDQVAKSGLQAQYVAMIQQHVMRNWNQPPSARSGLKCTVRVSQTPGGAVLSAQIDQCNGDAAVRQSIEAAVLRASPLPTPPDPRLFERVLVFEFKPLD